MAAREDTGRPQWWRCALALGLIVAMTTLMNLYARPALAAPPVNDNFASATIATFPAVLSGTTTEATLQAGEPNQLSGCRNVRGQVEPTFSLSKTVWYRVFPNVTTVMHLTLAGPNSNFDTTIAVYTGTFGNLSLQACNEDLTPVSETPQSRRSGLAMQVFNGAE